jgi:hypothetical protein
MKHVQDLAIRITSGAETSLQKVSQCPKGGEWFAGGHITQHSAPRIFESVAGQILWHLAKLDHDR